MLIVRHCPACGSKNVRKSRSKGVLGSTFFFTRFRCRDCRMRFRKMRWTAAATALAMSTIFGVVVYTAKEFVQGTGGKRDSSGQQWDVAGEPTAEVKRKARLGDPEAQYQLGAWHRQANRGVDDKAAVDWLKRASDKGHQDAKYQLALLYSEGRGVLQDNAESAKLIIDLVQKGHVDSQAQLGNMYRRGIGFELSKPNAYLWYNLAASNGNREASAMRDTIGGQLSTTELSEAQRQARVLEQTLRSGKDLGVFKPILVGEAKGGAAAMNAAPAPAAAPTAAPAAAKP
jgi:TPR repeat protein